MGCGCEGGSTLSPAQSLGTTEGCSPAKVQCRIIREMQGETTMPRGYKLRIHSLKLAPPPNAYSDICANIFTVALLLVIPVTAHYKHTVDDYVADKDEEIHRCQHKKIKNRFIKPSPRAMIPCLKGMPGMCPKP